MTGQIARRPWFRAALAALCMSLGCEHRQALAVDLRELCAKLPCRQVRGSGPPLPYVNGDVVTIYEGESFAVTGTPKGDELADLRFAAPDEKGPVIKLTFEIHEGHSFLMLSNGFDRMVKYSAQMVVGDDPRPQATSTCPIIPLGGAFERWAQPLKVIFLARFHFLNPAGGFVCD